jgi:CubicO group peptidase (beta-lactamase class C family)
MKLFKLFFLVSLLATSLYPQENLGFKKNKIQPPEVNELEVFSEKFFKEKNLEANHALVVLVKDNKTFFKTYPEHSKSFTELTKFNSRVFEEIFTTFSFLQLHELEKVNLRGDIATYKWKYDKNFKQNILVENLLTHSTGIQENIIYKDSSKERTLDFWKNSSLHRYAEPNEFIGYDADNLKLLQSILEEVTGKKKSEFIQDSILSKLSLENSSFEQEHLTVTGKDLSSIVPIFLNPEDLFQKGILKKETWNEIFQEKLRLEDKLPGSMIGFFEHQENNTRGYSRISETNDSSEAFVFFPDKASSVYVYTNSYNPVLRRELVSEFLDQFFSD